ncbi:glycosyltransferase family 4 protein [Sphingomonas sp. R86521]|uniref:glycosyltransferase family 4 protein n=1 Tax=Sphingomonas sp. R86521 TaxID=3093860 RepID=UPI0036D35D72
MNANVGKEKAAHEALGVPLCTDGRLFVREGDGVARYSRALHAALEVIDPALLVVHDRFSAVPRGKTEFERVRRWTEARIAPGTVRLRERPPGILMARDVFRRAHSHYKRRGTLLRLVAPEVVPGLVHWSYPMPIELVGWRNVYTIHDTIPLTHPHLTTIDVDLHRRLLAAIGARATAIATISEAARTDIIDTLSLAPDKVVDLGQSVDVGTGTDPLPAGLTAGAYFLFVGGDNPRKNGERVLQAWRQSGAVRPLVMIGPGDRWKGEPGTVRLPFQPDGTLAALIAGARALVFPSLGEGFGRPIAEAMALGTAVLTARGHATEEVAGGAALLVDPLDAAEIARGIAALDRDDALVERLKQAGRQRAPAFARDGFARRLVSFYVSLIASTEPSPYASR